MNRQTPFSAAVHLEALTPTDPPNATSDCCGTKPALPPRNGVIQ